MRLKKVGILLLVLVMSLSMVLAGCGDDGKDAGPNNASGGDKVVKIGLIQPLTGSIAYGGQSCANGSILAVEEINAAGGIDVNGEKYKIELVVEDDKGVPKEAAAAATKLISKDNVPIIVGTFTSSSTFAAAEIANREGIPIISPLSSATNLTTSGFEYFFRGRVTTRNNVELGAKTFAAIGPFKKIAMLAINDDWGKGDLADYPANWEKIGVEVTAKETFDQGQTDFYPAIQKMLGTKPDALFITASTEPAAMIFKQIRELDPNIAVLTSGGIDPAKCAELAGTAIERLWFWSVDPPFTDEIVAWDKKYEARFNMTTMSNARSGYDVIQIVANAIADAGAIEPKAIRDALSKQTYDGLQGYYNFDETGESFLKMFYGYFPEGGNGSFEIFTAEEALVKAEQLRK